MPPGAAGRAAADQAAAGAADQAGAVRAPAEVAGVAAETAATRKG